MCVCVCVQDKKVNGHFTAPIIIDGPIVSCLYRESLTNEMRELLHHSFHVPVPTTLDITCQQSLISNYAEIRGNRVC